MKRTTFSVIAVVFLISLWGAPTLFAAKYDLPSLSCPFGSGCGTVPPSASPLLAYIARLYQIALAVSGILAVGMIVAGSLYYTFAGGSTDREREGKEMITSALWGIALLFGSWLILRTVNPALVVLKVPDLPQAEVSGGSPFTNLLGKCSPDAITGLKTCPPGKDDGDVPGCLDAETVSKKFLELTNKCFQDHKNDGKEGGGAGYAADTDPGNTDPPFCHPFYKTATSTYDPSKEPSNNGWPAGKWKFC